MHSGQIIGLTILGLIIGGLFFLNSIAKEVEQDGKRLKK